MLVKMQAKQQVSNLEAQQLDAEQRLQTVQTAVKEQTHLLQRQRAALGQSLELVAMEKMEEDISRAQEVIVHNISSNVVVLATTPLMCEMLFVYV